VLTLSIPVHEAAKPRNIQVTPARYPRSGHLTATARPLRPRGHHVGGPPRPGRAHPVRHGLQFPHLKRSLPYRGTMIPSVRSALVFQLALAAQGARGARTQAPHTAAEAVRPRRSPGPRLAFKSYNDINAMRRRCGPNPPWCRRPGLPAS
jgi:hypothetical protein